MKTKIKKNSTIRICEFPLVITLSVFGVNPLRLENDHNNLRKFWFLYSKEKRTQKLISDYWQNKLKVSPRDFYNSTRDIKSMMRSTEQTYA